MKVVVYGAQTALGIALIQRFHKEGHRVVGVYTIEKPVHRADVSHGSYVIEYPSAMRPIFLYEKPSMVIYALLDEQMSAVRSEEKIQEVSMLARLSDEHKTGKVIFFSTLEVYGTQSQEETASVQPKSLRGKTDAACEQTLLSFRAGSERKTCILRVGDVWGEWGYDTLITQMLMQKDNKKAMRTFEKRWSIPLYVGDAADACVRCISDFANGIYNICGEVAVSAGEIAGWLGPAYSALAASAPPAVPDCKKAQQEIGFIRLYSAKDAALRIQAWYQNNTHHTLVTPPEKRQRFRLLFYIESAAIFAGLVFLQSLFAQNVTLTGFDLMLLYVMIAAAFGGIGHGLFAALLAGGFEVVTLFNSGLNLSALVYSYGLILTIVMYMAIALCIGYVVERRDVRIGELNDQLEHEKNDNQYIRRLNEELGSIKMEYENKLMRYEDGLARLYTVFSHIHSIKENEILLKTPSMIHSLTGEQNISVYLVQRSSGYLRFLTHIGAPSEKIPTAFRYIDVAIYRELIEQGTLYANRHLDPDMPDIIMPIHTEDEVLALVVVEHYSFDKYTLYDLNLMEIAGSIVSGFCRRSKNIQQLTKSILYEPESNILKEMHFSESLVIAQSATQDSLFVYVLLSLPDSGKENDRPLAKDVASLIRKNDEVGRLPGGKMGVLLYASQKEQAYIVIERLREQGIAAHVEED